MLKEGTILQQNRYRIVRTLGHGGMGAVYRAWHIGLEIPVAIKEMVPQPELDPQALAQLRGQFKREAVTLARLSHNNLVHVIDSFEEGGNAYLVMEMVEGECLADCITREGALPEALVLRWAHQLLDALAYCHGQGVIHRDIKPHNIIIRSDGQAVLVDFGLVKLWDPRDPRTKTVVRGMGTPEYAPPEQYDVEAGHTDVRSDIYALGATLYHALAGQAPPTATQRIVNPEALAPLRALVPGVDSRTEAVLLEALELRPIDRFQSAREMAAALRRQKQPAAYAAPAISEPQPPAPPSKGQPAPSAGLAQEPVSPKMKTKAMPRVETGPRPPESGPPAAGQAGGLAAAGEKLASAVKRRVPIWAWIVGVLVFLCVCCWLGSVLQQRRASQEQAIPTPQATLPPKEEPTATLRPQATPTSVPAEVEPPFKIGMVADLGGVDDHSFNWSAWQGVQQAGKEFGAAVKVIEPGDTGEYEESIRKLADLGYDVIVTVGFAQFDATTKVARAYPNVKFIGIDQSQTQVAANLAGLVFHEDRAGYLAGVLAARLTKSGTIAAVLGSELVPPVVAFKEGYAAGARSVRPDIRVLANYHPGEMGKAFTDPEWGAATAALDVRAGADVVFAAAGETGRGALMEAASHPGVYCIGVDTDQWNTVPEAHPCLASSAMKRITPGIVELIRLVRQGKFRGGNFYGEVGLAPYYDFEDRIPQDVKAEVAAIARELNEGKIDMGAP